MPLLVGGEKPLPGKDGEPLHGKDKSPKTDPSMDFNKLISKEKEYIIARCRVLSGNASDGTSLAVGISKTGQPIFVQFQFPKEGHRIGEFLLIEDQTLNGSKTIDFGSNFEFLLPVTWVVPLPPRSFNGRIAEWDLAQTDWYLVRIAIDADKTISCKITKAKQSSENPISLFVLKELSNLDPGKTADFTIVNGRISVHTDNNSIAIVNGSASIYTGKGSIMTKMEDLLEFIMHWAEPTK